MRDFHLLRSASSPFLGLLCGLLCGLSACSETPPQGQSSSQPSSAAAPSPASAPSVPPSATPPFATLSSRDRSPAPGGGRTIEAPGAKFELPAEWTSETPSSSMRLAQAVIPGAAGPGQLAVFHFGSGGGGGVDANLERWLSQVEPNPGETPRRDSFSAGNARVTWIEVAGTLLPSTMGSGPTTPQPGSRLLAAVVEGPGGPWFFKATGPDRTLAEQREAFFAMLKAVQLAG